MEGKAAKGQSKGMKSAMAASSSSSSNEDRKISSFPTTPPPSSSSSTSSSLKRSLKELDTFVMADMATSPSTPATEKKKNHFMVYILNFEMEESDDPIFMVVGAHSYAV